jgi:hypothetical protein
MNHGRAKRYDVVILELARWTAGGHHAARRKVTSSFRKESWSSIFTIILKITAASHHDREDIIGLAAAGGRSGRSSRTRASPDGAGGRSLQISLEGGGAAMPAP